MTLFEGSVLVFLKTELFGVSFSDLAPSLIVLDAPKFPRVSKARKIANLVREDA